MSISATIALTGALALGGTALASAASTTSGTIHLIAYGDGEGVGSTIIFTGAIADSGTAIDVDLNGTVDPSGQYVELSLVHGSFMVNNKAADEAVNNAFNKIAINPNTCSGTVSANATSTIVAGSGTRAYQGISGSVTLALTFELIGAKYTSGKHKGQCNESDNSPTLGQAEVVTGSGSVSL